MAAHWAKNDLGNAVNWVKSLPESSLKSHVMVDVSYQWTETSPLEAATYAAQQNDPELLRAVVGKWADQSPQTAAAWVSEWPAGGLRDSAFTHLAHIWSQKDPVVAANYTASMPEGAARDQALVAVATVWATASPYQTAEWVSQFPEGAAREQAMARLVTAWAGARPEEAGQWLNTLKSGSSKDFAVRAYSNALRTEFPDKAFEWANAISSATMREEQLEQVAIIWMARDQIAARRSVFQSDLPKDIQMRFSPSRWDAVLK